MNLHRRILTHNDCHRIGRGMIPRGVMVHSTGANNPNLSRYVPGDAVIGTNSGGNHWDQSNREWQKKFGTPLNKCAHAFIGKLADGGVGTVQTLPWDMAGWHAGGSANSGYIGFEICEDGLNDSEYFRAVYQEAVELTAMLCKDYGLNPMADGVVICHAEGYRRGIASNHGDVLHWFGRFGKTMDEFRADVRARMDEEVEEITQEQFDELMENWLKRQGEQPVAHWAKEKLELAKAEGITDGTRPQAFATRQEVALMVRAAVSQ